MKKTIIIIFLLSIVTINAQQNAITERGEEVVLFENGKWEYKNQDESQKKEITTNSKKFKKSDNSTFLLKSNKLNIGFWLDAKKWTFKKAEYNPEAEYELFTKNGDLYGMIITEKVEIPLETLRTIAVENGRMASPDLKIIKEEYRTVNDLKVLLLKMNGTMQGIKFSYYGYYYSNENGTVQFITYTSQKLIKKYVSECDELLNGLVKL